MNREQMQPPNRRQKRRAVMPTCGFAWEGRQGHATSRLHECRRVSCHASRIHLCECGATRQRRPSERP